MPPIFVVNCPKCDMEFYADKFLWDAGPDSELLCPNCLLRFKRKEGKNLVPLFATGPDRG